MSVTHKDETVAHVIPRYNSSSRRTMLSEGISLYTEALFAGSELVDWGKPADGASSAPVSGHRRLGQQSRGTAASKSEMKTSTWELPLTPAQLDPEKDACWEAEMLRGVSLYYYHIRQQSWDGKVFQWRSALRLKRIWHFWSSFDR